MFDPNTQVQGYIIACIIYSKILKNDISVGQP